MGSYNPFKSLTFLSQQEAIEAAKSQNFGVLKRDKIGTTVFELNNDDEPIRDTKDDMYFSSETSDWFYNYTIEKHETLYILQIYRTYKHRMISAAIDGNLDLFIEYFDDREKMIEFSLSTSIIHNNLNIVEYLINKYDFIVKAIWLSIRYDKIEILKYLQSKEFKLPNDWLAYAMYSNSINVLKELLDNQKLHLRFSKDELKTRWYIKEINKDNISAKFVREFFSKQ